MLRIVRCTNPECGRLNQIGDDGLRRIFRCVGCLARLCPAPEADGPGPAAPTAPRPAADIEPDDDPDILIAPAARRPPTSAGARFGRYHIRRLLGAGNFASVYRAFDPDLERDVALKILRDDAAADAPQRAARFLAEARTLARLRYPGIVAIHEVGCVEGRRYLAMNLVDGRTLEQVVADGPIDFAESARLVAEIAESLDHAHGQGIVHRDIKPANILIDADGSTHLMDFGLAAREDSADRITQAGAILGTPAYVSPEQALGGGEPNPSNDQYALGVVLYELLSGRPPFRGLPSVVLYQAVHQPPTPPRSIDPSVPEGLEAICLRATAKRPGDRYPSCRALAEDLRRWLRSEPIEAGRRPRARPPWWRKRPIVAAASALAASSLLGLGLRGVTHADGATAGPADPPRAEATLPGRLVDALKDAVASRPLIKSAIQAVIDGD